ncbi:MAG TPA: T9SS type A sorting domain-containing protein, partial [Bacteroidia bacterium]|nr:T9SS type A sorting domain-containing protein [Bacteroidia bacterium]
NQIHKAVFLEDVRIEVHTVFDSLLLNNPGHILQLMYGNPTLTITQELVASPLSGFPLQISGGTISKSSGQVCSNYLIIQNNTATGGAQFFAGLNSVDLGGNSGWAFTQCMPNNPNVWPGDANYDLTADNLDVLNIGLAYGYTGPVRSGASLAWIAQPATDWFTQFATGANLKHADCDGNGIVDNLDTTAISLNYGLTHPYRLVNPNSNQSITPQLYLIANPDTVLEGDTIEVDIYLGTQLAPVDSIYGLAFTINFDSALVDTSWMPFDFTGSWMGTPGIDLLTYDKKHFSQGKVDIALTRTDHANVSGYGYLGKMGAVIVDNVGIRLTSNPPYVTLPLSVSNVTALTATEFYLTISTGTENVEIDTLGMTGVHSSPGTNSPFSVYPNPVHKKLNVFSYWLKGETNCTFELYDVMGEKVISKQVPVSQNRFSADVSTIPQGIYFIKVITAKGTVNKKILVVNK